MPYLFLIPITDYINRGMEREARHQAPTIETFCNSLVSENVLMI